MLTDDQLAARTERAVAAATAAGRELGLTVTDPQVLYNVFSVIVHLKPSPVVVRVPTVLPRTTTLQTQLVDQRRELSVAGWLAQRGHPVVPPSPLVPAEPVQRDGFSMTFWQFVEQVKETEVSTARAAEVAARMHAVLREYPGELGFMGTADSFVTDGLAQLTARPDLVDPADVERAKREWDLLRPLFATEEAFAEAFPAATIQPIHGDAPGYNLIVTPDGELCSDFELVTRGPVEWDLGYTGEEGAIAYNAAAERLGLRKLDNRLLKALEALRMLQLVACMAQAPELPLLVDGVKPMLDQWRATPFDEELVTTTLRD
ncbi:MAG: aminoglycoside phosphotransferase family protein [Kibdelosporangium sp.]